MSTTGSGNINHANHNTNHHHGGNSLNQVIEPSSSSSGINNNSGTGGKVPEISPFVVSLSHHGESSRRINRNHLLPPLAGEGAARTPTSSSRKTSSRSSSSKNRHHQHGLHRVPHPRSKTSSGKRSHSAAAAASASVLSTPIDSVPSSPARKSHHSHHPEHKSRHHHGRSSHRSAHLTSATITPGSEAYLRSPKSSRNRVNKIETVRVLRARPLFYPIVKERYSGGSPVPGSGIRVRSRAATAAPSTLSQLAALELPYPGIEAEPRHHVLGKKISLRADPKRKRKGLASADTTSGTPAASSSATSMNL